MSQLIILATNRRVNVHHDGGVTQLKAGIPGSDRLAFSIDVANSVLVHLTAQTSACELHRSNPDGSPISGIQAGDPVTRCLQANKKNSNDLKKGRFFARPKSRRLGTEIPHPQPGQKTHGKKDKDKLMNYVRGKLVIDIKP